MFASSTLHGILLCQTLSKAFDKSRKIASVDSRCGSGELSMAGQEAKLLVLEEVLLALEKVLLALEEVLLAQRPLKSPQYNAFGYLSHHMQ